MRISYTRNYVRVIGKIWMPPITAAMEYTLSDSELESNHIDRDNPTRDQIQRWVSTETGDFRSIEDFSADIGDRGIVPWFKEESECTYNDCMFPGDES